MATGTRKLSAARKPTSELAGIAQEFGTSARRPRKHVDPSVYKWNKDATLVERISERGLEVIKTKIVEGEISGPYLQITVRLITGQELPIKTGPRFKLAIKRGDRVSVKYIKSKRSGFCFGGEVTHHMVTKKTTPKKKVKQKHRKVRR